MDKDKEYRPSNSILYASQQEWGIKEYENLKSILNKNFLYEHEKNRQLQIQDYDLSKMAVTTKVIMKALLLYYGTYEEMLNKYDNLKPLNQVGPLKEPLYLSERPHFNFKGFKDMNIVI